MEQQPLLSACLITYNQVKYIKDAIESIFAQKVNFKWEFIIADDFSTDGTIEIIKEYAQKHPQLIRVLPRTKNVGPGKNFLELIGAANGKYLAYLEGDDYWTDENKLQKQVDFLESNPDYAFCYHHVNIIQEGNIQNRKLEMVLNQPEISTIAEILKKSIWPHLNSVVFRNEKNLKNIPSWFLDCPSGDWALMVIITKDKKIKYFNQTMSIYRQHDAGIWSKKTKKQNFYNTLKTSHLLNKYQIKADEKKFIYWPMHYAYKGLIEHYKLNNPIKAFYLTILSTILYLRYNFVFSKY